MPSKSNAKSKPAKPSPSSSSPTSPSFIRKDYYRVLPYHLCLLFGSLLLLPRTRSSYTSRWGLGGVDEAMYRQTTSADRPEHPWLTPITANPTRTLVWHLMGEAVVVIMWGQHLVSLSGANRVEDKQKRVAQNLQRLREAAITTASSIPIISILLPLLGAPLAFRTVLLAAHAALLLVWAPSYALGFGSHGSASRYRVKRIFSSFSAESQWEKAVLYPAVGAIAGGWLGGTLLALDWDRPWQTYPLTPVFGSLVGYTIGHLSH